MSEGLRDGEAVHLTDLGSGRLHVETVVVVHHDCFAEDAWEGEKQDKCVSRKYCEKSGCPEFGIPIGKGHANEDCMLTCEKHARKTIAKITQSKYK
jgi:hypothetical protein